MATNRGSGYAPTWGLPLMMMMMMMGLPSMMMMVAAVDNLVSDDTNFLFLTGKGKVKVNVYLYSASS